MKVTISGQQREEPPMRIVIDLVGSEAAEILRFFNFHPLHQALDLADDTKPVAKLLDALQRVAAGRG
jgi:hypothetical protein